MPAKGRFSGGAKHRAFEHGKSNGRVTFAGWLTVLRLHKVVA